MSSSCNFSSASLRFGETFCCSSTRGSSALQKATQTHHTSKFTLLGEYNVGEIENEVLYLGLCMNSTGLGAWMTYSSNLGFRSSSSFFPPEDFTSGFTGSGGFSLLWQPFMHPWIKNVLCYVVSYPMIRSKTSWQRSGFQ